MTKREDGLRSKGKLFDEPLVRASKVAELLDVSAETVLRWASEGILPHYRPAETTVRFKLSEISAWVDCCRAPCDPQRASERFRTRTEQVTELEAMK